MPTRTPAIRAYSTAKGFCQCGVAMVGGHARFSLPDDTSLFMGFHHLIGFAVELYLKAFLLAAGLTEEELRRPPYGHNLDTLLHATLRHGLKCADAAMLCSYLRQHGSFEYRYMKPGSMYPSLPINLLLAALSELDNLVDRHVGASAGMGKEPGGRWEIPELHSAWRFPEA